MVEHQQLDLRDYLTQLKDPDPPPRLGAEPSRVAPKASTPEPEPLSPELGAEWSRVAPKPDPISQRRQELLQERAELTQQGLISGSLYRKWSNPHNSYWRHQWRQQGRRKTKDYKLYPRDLAQGIQRQQRVKQIEKELRQLGGV